MYSIEASIDYDNSDVSAEVEISGNTVTITAEAGFDSYQWKVDGVVQQSVTNVLELDMSDWKAGVYDVVLCVKKGEEVYSWTTTISKE